MAIREAFLDMLHPNFSAPKLTTWFCPSVDKLKLNTDGSSKRDPGQSGYGGFLRDEVGTSVWGYHGYLAHCTSLEAKL
ncbi:hypothetical protein ACSBR1_025708 [Camellia fascicularis]